MPRRWTILTLLGAALAAANMGDDGCTEWDQDQECEQACAHLTGCENGWLGDEGKPMLDSDTADEATPTRWTRYYDDCCADCEMHGDEDEIGCVQDATCDELLDGKCSD